MNMIKSSGVFSSFSKLLLLFELFDSISFINEFIVYVRKLFKYLDKKCKQKNLMNFNQVFDKRPK
jgi:hypothetical protein